MHQTEARPRQVELIGFSPKCTVSYDLFCVYGLIYYFKDPLGCLQVCPM